MDSTQKDIEEIVHGGKTLAMVYRKHIKAEKGIRFLTPTHYPLQVGLIEHPEGKDVPVHIHRNLVYDVNTTQEMLYIEKGQVDITVTTNDWEEVAAFTLTDGDFVLFVSGGHGVKIHKDTRIIEIKQGPYPGDKEAKIFKTDAK